MASGERLRFDAILVAVGARPIEALPGSTTFWASDDDPAFGRLLGRLELEEGLRIAFAVSGAVPWTLPIYELAIGTAEWCCRRGLTRGLSIVTPEEQPLAVFGGEASTEIGRILDDHGIDLRLGRDPLEFCARLRSEPGADHSEAVVSLPRLIGRGMPDLPFDADRFLPVDEFGRVVGVDGIYAAGDVTDSPIKQGGLGAQQADAAASAIAADLGGRGRPEPFGRFLRGRIEGVAPRYLQRHLDDGGDALVVDAPLWWPAAKVHGKHLGPFLAALARIG